MHTAIILASGPSLTQADVDYCRGKGRVYAVKECRHMAPWADVMYAADADWWQRYKGCPDFKGERWTCDADAAKKYGLNHIPYKPASVWSTDPAYIATGGNSGFQTANLAALNPECTGIILLGFDYGFKPGTDKHWWERLHPRESRPSNYKEWVDKFVAAAPHIPVPVLNASRLTAIPCFPRVELMEVL